MDAVLDICRGRGAVREPFVPFGRLSWSACMTDRSALPLPTHHSSSVILFKELTPSLRSVITLASPPASGSTATAATAATATTATTATAAGRCLYLLH